MITGKQSRAARAMLGWSIDELAERSGVDRGVIHRFENGATNVRQSSIEALCRCFLREDLEFIGHKGVSEKESTVDFFQGSDCIQKVWDHILKTFSDGRGGEVMATNVDERQLLDNKNVDLVAHLNNLKELNVDERLLSCEGDKCFVAPRESYRWLPKERFFIGRSTLIYRSKVAYFLSGDDIALLVHSQQVYEVEKKRFEVMWENAIIPPQS